MGVVRTDDRWIGGVCAGLAHRFNLDPLLVRGIVAVTVLVGGFGIVAYGVAWALLPEARDGRIHLQETLAGRFDSAVLGALGMVLAGLIRGDGWMWWGRTPGVFYALSWFAFVAVVITVVVIAATASDRKKASVPYYRASQPMTAPPIAPAVDPAYGYSGPPPVPWTPRPRVHGPGRTTVGVVVAVVLMATAGLLMASRTGHLDAPVALVGAGVCVVLAGLGIVVSGLRGRRSGVLGFIAIITLVVAGPWAVVEASDWPAVNRSTIVINDLRTAERGVTQDVGEIVVDLRYLADLAGERTPTPEPAPSPDVPATPDVPDVPDVPDPPDVPDGAKTDVPEPAKTEGPKDVEPVKEAQALVVPVDVGAGDVTIILPQGVSTRVEVDLGVGEVFWQPAGAVPDHSRGVSVLRTFRTDLTDPDPVLVVRVNMGVGRLTIQSGA